MNEYDGKQFVGIDLHQQRSVIVRQSESGPQLSAVRDPAGNPGLCRPTSRPHPGDQPVHTAVGIIRRSA